MFGGGEKSVEELTGPNILFKEMARVVLRGDIKLSGEKLETVRVIRGEEERRLNCDGSSRHGQPGLSDQPRLS